jgi:hypothetical protein
VKIEGSAKHISEHHGRQQEELRSPYEIDQVFSAPGIGLLVLMMSDEGVGEDGDDFVKKIEGEYVRCKETP